MRLGAAVLMELAAPLVEGETDGWGAVARRMVVQVLIFVVGGAIGWTLLKVGVGCPCLLVVDSGHFSAK